MPKVTSSWICQECGYTSPAYIGKCPECKAWGTISEEITSKKSDKLNLGIATNNSFHALSDLDLSEVKRIKSYDSELDDILGGGFVLGSLILLAGEPGIGKSTILLQIANGLSNTMKVAYVTAEESTYQVKLRAQRLNVKDDKQNLLLLAENNLEVIFSLIEQEKPDFLILDSIQAIYDPSLESSNGSVGQVKECANKILRLCKDKHITTVIVGHVNKEGLIAGPKVLEHIVDTVLYFEGEKFHNFRIIRATKNRFGCTDETAFFEMKDNGLESIANPSSLFISRNLVTVPGSTFTTIVDGSKTIIAEVQALVGGSGYSTPRRTSNGLDFNRVLQIIAILERRAGYNFSKQDIFVNLVGGLASSEPALDLSIAMSIISCVQDVPPSKKTAYIGEIGLTGEIRQVTKIESRIKECIKLGFERIIVPKETDIQKFKKSNSELIYINNIAEAISKHQQSNTGV